jgi:hypothetical protein
MQTGESIEDETLARPAFFIHAKRKAATQREREQGRLIDVLAIQGKSRAAILLPTGLR